MTKNFNIKKIQLGKSADLEKLKAKLAGEKEPKKEKEKEKEPPKKPAAAALPEEEQPRRIRAKSRSSFEPLTEEEKLAEAAAQASKEEPAAVEEPAPVEEEIPKAAVEEKAPAKEKAEEEKPPLSPLPTPHAAPKAPPARPAFTPRPGFRTPVIRSSPTPPPSAPAKAAPPVESEADKKKKKVREFRDLKPKADKPLRPHGAGEEDDRWRKKRAKKSYMQVEEISSRPTQISVRLPITIKDLAEKMKRKTSELIQKLFLHGITLTLNDFLDDETMVQFIGTELACEITVDRTLEDKISVVKASVREEIAKTEGENLSQTSRCHLHGPRRPWQDQPDRCYPKEQCGLPGGGCDHPAHRRLPLHNAGRRYHRARHPGPRSLLAHESKRSSSH